MAAMHWQLRYAVTAPDCDMTTALAAGLDVYISDAIAVSAMSIKSLKQLSKRGCTLQGGV
jgi:hypothetical protein